MNNDAPIDEILRLAAQHDGKRICRVEVEGEFFWVKWSGFNDRPWRKRLHKLADYMPLPIWARLAPLATGAEAVQREVDKIDSFRAAGFQVPHYIYSDETKIVFKNLDTLLPQALLARRANGNNTDANLLLINAARTLGSLHAAGLCHGRPNLKDMFVEGQEVGFFDFEEKPEAVMPLLVAQARDCWLLFLFLCDNAKDDAIALQAFAAYCETAPKQVLVPLKRIVNFWHPWAIFGGVMSFIRTGSEMRRIILSDRVLYPALERSILEPA